ncbi:hypothetical protein NDN08_007381 [Rhodosorus marinus]|uniref:Uncharacterized protein n=1 Tax=Rhodosorus marinus TaxID=101924 RepID=A0AAV8UXE3_9RHOD|nr:hypothetical protein NDN08_007381 [Rhodosorus marinus]
MCLQKFEAPAGNGDGCCNTDICVFPYAVASKGSRVVTAHPELGRKKCRIEQGDVFARCDIPFLCDGRIGPTPTPTPVPQTCESHAANQEVITLGGSSNRKCYDLKLMGVGDTVGQVCVEMEYTNKWCIKFRFEMYSDEWIFTRLEAGAWTNCSDEQSSPFQIDRTDGPWSKKSVYVCLNRFSSPFDCCNTSICVIPRAEAWLKSDHSVVEDVFPVMGEDDCSQYFSEASVRCQIGLQCGSAVEPTPLPPTPTPVPQTCESHAANQEVITLGGSSNRKCYDLKLMGRRVDFHSSGGGSMDEL